MFHVFTEPRKKNTKGKKHGVTSQRPRPANPNPNPNLNSIPNSISNPNFNPDLSCLCVTLQRPRPLINVGLDPNLSSD